MVQTPGEVWLTLQGYPAVIRAEATEAALTWVMGYLTHRPSSGAYVAAEGAVITGNQI